MKRLGAWLCCALLVVITCGCAQPKKAVNEIELWHWMTDRQDALEALARKYEQETGIRVKLSLFAPSDSYIQKIIAAAQANVLPDIYGILDKKTIFASFIKAGLVADLTSAFEADGNAWGKRFFVKAVDNNRFAVGNMDGVKPGIYGVPLDVSTVQMIYNRNLLKKAGIATVPATFEEFLAAVKALKRVGIVPFVTGFGETWIVDCFASNYAFNIMGEAKVMATFRGEVPYTDPDWMAVFTVFQTLAKKGAFIEGIVTKGNKYAEQDFALERAAFSFDGSWGVNIYKSMNPVLDYGVAHCLPLRRLILCVYGVAPGRLWSLTRFLLIKIRLWHFYNGSRTRLSRHIFRSKRIICRLIVRLASGFHPYWAILRKPWSNPRIRGFGS